MRRAAPFIAILSLALSACSAERSPSEADVAAAPVAEADTADAVDGPRAIADAGDARMNGYGALDLGLTAEEARVEWTGGALQGKPDPRDPAACFHLSPAGQSTPAQLAFMFENDVLVRYSVESPDIVAPGGGKVGMDEAAIQALYGGTLETLPHKYVQGGKVLRSAEDGGGLPSKLVFELDAAGKVISWRVGMVPQIDYVEGCS
ncbi:lectin [Luteimonas sp. MC1828]|uniref:lectin n=1 Tax=Luteimonas sp. MC1828 TaxID=2799787 RepID=UPI0018F1906E|nr:lectin [Luteimonas sp. MC1828]MBJ7575899.1 lectin [Luteimonas sp. MC1828]